MAPSSLDDHVPSQFEFDAETTAKIIDCCPVSEEWMEQFRQGAVESVATPVTWRWIDRQRGRPISKTEDRSLWMFEQMVGGKGL